MFSQNFAEFGTGRW